MMSTTSKFSAIDVAEVLTSEGERKHVDHRLHAFGGVDEQVRTAVLPQQLTAASARHEHVAAEVDAGEGDQAPATGGVQGRHQPALGAQAKTVGGVLDVAA